MRSSAEKTSFQGKPSHLVVVIAFISLAWSGDRAWRTLCSDFMVIHMHPPLPQPCPPLDNRSRHRSYDKSTLVTGAYVVEVGSPSPLFGPARNWVLPSSGQMINCEACSRPLRPAGVLPPKLIAHCVASICRGRAQPCRQTRTRQPPRSRLVMQTWQLAHPVGFQTMTYQEPRT